MPKKDEDICSSQHAVEKKQASQMAYGSCPECNEPLQIKHVGKSTFLGCTAYPECHYSHSLNKHEVTTLKTIENSHCPECDALLAVKKGHYGMFIGCTNFPTCHFISTKQNTPAKSEYEPVGCPSCKSGQLLKKQNRFGKFFYACNNYPKCKHILNQQPVSQTCPECKAPIMLLKAKESNILICANSDCAHEISE